MDIIDINTLFGPLPAAATDLTVDDIEQLMQKNSILRCCTLSTIGLLLDHVGGNGATRAACASHAGLTPVATVNPQMYFGGEGLFDRFAQDGFKMVRFFPAAQGWSVDYAPFIMLLKHLAPQKLPIMVQVDHAGLSTRLMRSLGDYPNPVILSTIDERTLSESVVLMREYPNVYIETSELLSTGAIKYVVDTVEADRVLYGSGAPIRPMASSIGVLRHSGLTDAQFTQVLGGNAKRLLNL